MPASPDYQRRPRVYRLGGLYVQHTAREHLLPQLPVSIGLDKIENSLTTKFFPGVFGILGYFPSQLETVLKGIRIKGFCLAAGNWTPHTMRLTEHPTWTNIEHAMAFGRTGDEAHIEAVWKLGQEVWKKNGPPIGRRRRIKEYEKVATNIWTMNQARQYVDRLVGLSRFIEGLNGVPFSGYFSGQSGRLDGDIGVAIAASGQLLHFRKGHHRIMIAKQLGIPKVHVSVEVVHAEWLRESQGLSESELAAIFRVGHKTDTHAIAEAILEYVQNAGA